MDVGNGVALQHCTLGLLLTPASQPPLHSRASESDLRHLAAGQHMVLNMLAIFGQWHNRHILIYFILTFCWKSRYPFFGSAKSNEAQFRAPGYDACS